MISKMPFALSTILILLFANGVFAKEPLSKEQLFHHVFGQDVVLDRAYHKQVRSSQAGKRHYRDTNKDGKPNEVWFIDTAPRHPDRFRPLLVKGIDEDGDLLPGHEPDLDSDLYIADWKADGTVDAVLDYTDIDGDNDVDEMGMYFIGSGANYLPGPTLRVWWGRDNGDDNLLWYNVGYTYNQKLCQYRTHFGGEETFVAFALAQDDKEWIPFFENPFLFYDHDRDGVTEEVLRLSGYNTQVESMRHSFDADNDATQDHPRDFDVSITTWAPGGNPKPAQNQRGRSTLTIPPRYMAPISLRDIPCRGFLAHAHARHFVKPVTWEKLLLTWDEIDLNVDAENEYSDFDERWEGVIADGNQSFPQVGGPSGGPFNKRNELIAQSPAKTQLYYLPFDNRIHLKHAEQGWLDVDWNFDRAIDMRYTMRDTDKDGYIDRYEYDLNADGQIDDTWSINGPAKNIHLTWPDISTIRKPINNTMVKKQHKQNAALAAKIKSIDKKAWQRIQPHLPGLEKVKTLPPAVLHRLHGSHESKYYFTLLKRDYLICALKQLQIPKILHENLNRLRDQTTFSQWRDLLGLSPDLEMKSTHQKQKTLPTLALEVDKQSGTITWQTNKSTYRWRQGRFDFLKTQNKGKTITINIPKKGAQEQQELLYTNPPGCGLTLYINQTPYPLWHAKNQNNLEFTYKTLSHTQKKAVLEIRMENAGPKNQPCAVALQCTAFANREELKIQARVECDRSQEPLSLGIGLSKLQQEAVFYDSQSRILGLWGVHNPNMGRIGMGLVIPNNHPVQYMNLPNEHQVKIGINQEEWITCYILGKWRQNQRFPYCPSAADWMKQLKQ